MVTMTSGSEYLALTEEQLRYAQDNPGEIWIHPRTKELLVVVPLPEMSEPKELTRQRLVEGLKKAAKRWRGAIPGNGLPYLSAQCWTGDLLLIEHKLVDRYMGVVLQK